MSPELGGTEPRAEGQTPNRTVAPGLVSVLIPCYGQLEYTRLCVPSLLRFSRTPLELIFWDAGSLDGTAEYLAGVAAAAPVPVKVIKTGGDVAPTAAGTAGTVQARGEFIVLLSNDTIVTDRWLDHLVQLAGTDTDIGMVGPMSNYAPPVQRVDPVPYRLGGKKGVRELEDAEHEEVLRQIEEVNQFARQWREQHRGEWAAVDQLGGGCVLLKREAFMAAGLSLTQSPLGFFDLEVLSQRVMQAGYRLACCRDLFIHYFGSRGFAPARTSRGPLLS